ncbi:MAG: VOC family protein [Spirochaetales bacterium]|nr:VOC family protein [Spirochaetales bacterium]
MQFLWTTLSVTDYDKSLDFWTRVVGLSVQRTMTPPGMKIAFLGQGKNGGRGETQIELIWDSKKDHITVTKDLGIGFEVGDLDLEAQKLRSQGWEVRGPFQPNPAIRFFYVSAPDGWQVQFVQNL